MAALVVVIVALGLAMYFRLLPIPGPLLSLLIGAREPEHSARFYPDDTIGYVWLTLVPGGGQLNDMREIWERLDEMREFRSLLRTWARTLSRKRTLTSGRQRLSGWARKCRPGSRGTTASEMSR